MYITCARTSIWGRIQFCSHHRTVQTNCICHSIHRKCCIQPCPKCPKYDSKKEYLKWGANLLWFLWKNWSMARKKIKIVDNFWKYLKEKILSTISKSLMIMKKKNGSTHALNRHRFDLAILCQAIEIYDKKCGLKLENKKMEISRFTWKAQNLKIISLLELLKKFKEFTFTS